MKKKNLFFALMSILGMVMSVALTACGNDNDNEPENGSSKDMYVKLCNPLWGTFINSRTCFLSFSTDQNVTESFNRREHYGTWSFVDNNLDKIQINGNLSIIEYLGDSQLNLTISANEMTLYAPSTGNSVIFTNYSGGNDEGGDSESNERVSTRVLCITVITGGGNKSVSDEVYDWYRGMYGESPALYRSRSASDRDYVVLGRHNTDSSCEGYRVSGFDYKATDSPNLNTMKYYYFN